MRYVLEGSVRKAGQRARITGQLIDATTGNHIWSDRFDGALDDIFDLHDRVASSVVGAVEPRQVAVSAAMFVVGRRGSMFVPFRAQTDAT